MEWTTFLNHEFEQDYFKTLSQKLDQAYETRTVFPPRKELFAAFSYASYEETKVVIIGQDPYHQDHQAHGLCFSVMANESIPPSLQNIFKELQSDCGCAKPNSGLLVAWAQQGVLLLNASLSVEKNKPLSHQDLGWKTFYAHVLQVLNDHPSPLVFILWGKQAQQATQWITNPKHLILKAPHPSPLSAYHGFFGSKPFSQSNVFLTQNHRERIEWCLP